MDVQGWRTPLKPQKAVQKVCLLFAVKLVGSALVIGIKFQQTVNINGTINIAKVFHKLN